MAVALSSDFLRRALVEPNGASLREVSQTLLAQHPYYFERDPLFYTRVKDRLRSELDVGDSDIFLVGSGLTGFSMSPQKLFAPFGASSDLDFAIIAPATFDAVWHCIARWVAPDYYAQSRLPKEVKEWVTYWQRQLFWGNFAFHDSRSRLPPSLTLRPMMLAEMRDIRAVWHDTFNTIGSCFPGTDFEGRESHARIYRSKEHLETYQLASLEALSRKLREHEKESL